VTDPHGAEHGARSLALFFTHGMTLDTWRRAGLFPREVSYYQALAEAFGPVLFVTYDRKRQGLAEDVDAVRPVEVEYNRWPLPYPVFGLAAPFLLRSRLRRCAILKTNQIHGSWIAVIAKWLLRKPLVLRCGYVVSHERRWGGRRSLRRTALTLMERLAVRAANLVFVATEADGALLAKTHRVSPEKFRHVPTPIDTDRFRPDPAVARDPRHVIYVGRLVKGKNVDLLIDAVRALGDVQLTIVGGGALEAELRERAAGADVTFTGTLPNDLLPGYLGSAAVYVLVSDFEGSPKALLEAMACGLAVIGSRVPGTELVVRDGENGLLVERTAAEIAAAIRRLFDDPSLAQRLGDSARQFVLGRYSQAEIVRREAEYLRSLLP
jgi:glycosyltransferase involved in cell wall biosynthesis